MSFTGQFQRVSIDLDEPKIKFEAIDINQFTLLCGANGVGKSFMNKATYAGVLFLNIMCLKELHPEVDPLGKDFNDNDIAQFIMDNVFDDQDFNGMLKLHNIEPIMEVPDEFVDFTFVNGKVTVQYDLLGSTDVATPTYMSTSTRKFSALDNYLMIKDLQGISTIASFDSLEKLLKSFKIYEIFAMEKVLNNLSKVNNILTNLSVSELRDELPDIQEMYIKDNKVVGDIIDDNGDMKTRTISTLGDGHQALLMMFMTLGV